MGSAKTSNLSELPKAVEKNTVKNFFKKPFQAIFQKEKKKNERETTQPETRAVSVETLLENFERMKLKPDVNKRTPLDELKNFTIVKVQPDHDAGSEISKDSGVSDSEIVIENVEDTNLEDANNSNVFDEFKHFKIVKVNTDDKISSSDVMKKSQICDSKTVVENENIIREQTVKYDCIKNELKNFKIVKIKTDDISSSSNKSKGCGVFDSEILIENRKIEQKDDNFDSKKDELKNFTIVKVDTKIDNPSSERSIDSGISNPKINLKGDKEKKEEDEIFINKEKALKHSKIDTEVYRSSLGSFESDGDFSDEKASIAVKDRLTEDIEALTLANGNEKKTKKKKWVYVSRGPIRSNKLNDVAAHPYTITKVNKLSGCGAEVIVSPPTSTAVVADDVDELYNAINHVNNAVQSYGVEPNNWTLEDSLQLGIEYIKEQSEFIGNIDKVFANQGYVHTVEETQINASNPINDFIKSQTKYMQDPEYTDQDQLLDTFGKESLEFLTFTLNSTSYRNGNSVASYTEPNRLQIVQELDDDSETFSELFRDIDAVNESQSYVQPVEKLQEETPNPVKEFEEKCIQYMQDYDDIDQSQFLLDTFSNDSSAVFLTPPRSNENFSVFSPKSFPSSSPVLYGNINSVGSFNESNSDFYPSPERSSSNDLEEYQDVIFDEKSIPVSVVKAAAAEKKRKPSGDSMTKKQFEKLQEEIVSGFNKSACCKKEQGNCRLVFDEHMKKLSDEERKNMCIRVAGLDLNVAYGVLKHVLIHLSSSEDQEHLHFALFARICGRILSQRPQMLIDDWGYNLLIAAALRCPDRPILTRFLVQCIQLALRMDGGRPAKTPIFTNTDQSGDTLIHACARGGDKYAVVLSELLREKRLFDVHHANNDGYSPLHVACATHSDAVSCLHVVHVLLQHAGADIYNKDRRGGETSLHIAVNSPSCDLRLVLVIFYHEDKKNWHELAHALNRSSVSPVKYARDASESTTRKNYPLEVLHFLKKCRKNKA